MIIDLLDIGIILQELYYRNSYNNITCITSIKREIREYKFAKIPRSKIRTMYRLCHTKYEYVVSYVLV